MNKRLLYIFILLSLTNAAWTQIMQASIGPGSASNRLKIYVRPTGSNSNSTISTLQFNVGIPVGIEPKPTVSVTSNTTATWLGITWQVDYIAEGGYHNFYITTAETRSGVNLVSGQEYEVMEVEFTGSRGSTNASLVSLVDGGSNLNLLFLATGTIQSNGSNLYYARSGVAVNNQFSYDISGAGSGSGVSTATLGGITLPVRWLSFSALRQVNDGLISWVVDNDETNEKYIVERSTDGSNFVSVGEVSRRAGIGSKKYELLDKGITGIGTKIIYYRVKSVEVGNRHTYTDTKNIRLDTKGQISIYPIPARDGFTVAIPYLSPNQEKVQLQLVNTVGQVVDRKDITRAIAVNYYYNLQSSLITSGEYLLKIFEDGQLTETKKVVIKK